ncbi:hypothetical protein ACU635_35585 [[Actinomadura] parvosata]|uniref:hypothetical protein n=1 Tax=[Actinomadura] parvosata TaxID=1955412 RepID=UPI00406CB61E
MKKSWWAVVAVLASTVPAAGCGGGPGPEESGAGRDRPVVEPAGSIVPDEEGEDVPEATLAVCEECQRRLAARQYASAVNSMDRHAARASTQAAPIPSKRAVALLCAGVARTNLGLYREALANLAEADELHGHLPAQTRPQLLEMLYHAELISATAVGDGARKEAALEGLQATGRNVGPYVKEACGVAPDPAAVRTCGTSPPPGTTQPGTTQPGTTQPGTPLPGTTQPGNPTPVPQTPGPGEETGGEVTEPPGNGDGSQPETGDGGPETDDGPPPDTDAPEPDET